MKTITNMNKGICRSIYYSSLNSREVRGGGYLEIRIKQYILDNTHILNIKNKYIF